MSRNLSTHSQNLVLSLFMCVPLLAFKVFASETAVTGALDIEVQGQNIRNIIGSASASTANVNVGGVKQSAINGKAKININANDVRNHIVSGNRNSSIIRLGRIENSEVDSVTLDINAPSVESGINGGANNHATIDIGTIRNSVVKGSIHSSAIIRAGIVNRISGGSTNKAEVSIGAIEGENHNSPPTELSIPTYLEAQVQAQPRYINNSSNFNSATIPAQALLHNVSLVNHLSAPSASNQYRIEKRQSSIGDVGGHNFLVLKDHTGKVLYELHGLPVDTRTRKVAKKGISRHHGLRVIEFDHSKGENSYRIKIDQPSAVLFTGNRKQAMMLWERARQKKNDINKLKIPYPKMGVKLSGGTINSNSVESTLSAAMGLKSPKLKLPLTIQDHAEAIEYDKKPEQSFLFTPGENRIIHP